MNTVHTQDELVQFGRGEPQSFGGLRHTNCQFIIRKFRNKLVESGG